MISLFYKMNSFGFCNIKTSQIVAMPKSAVTASNMTMILEPSG